MGLFIAGKKSKFKALDELTSDEAKAYEEALRRIEECRLEKGTHLELVKFGLFARLTKVPAEIGQLTALTSLNLSGNHLKAVPSEMGKLTALEYLDLSGNQLTVVPARGRPVDRAYVS